MGRRIAKKIDGTITEKYLWQGLTRLLAVYDGFDNLLMRFEYADDRMPMAVNAEGVAYYLAYDQVGSLRLVADPAGNVIKSVEYDSFGNILSDSNPAFAMPLGFAGGLHDRDTGLVRFGYRDYDTEIGRWTAKDPIGFAGGDSDLYGYVLNDSVNLVDPYGLLSNPFGNLPSVSDAFPNSTIVAPIADIAIGGIEGGIAVASGIAGGILLTQPEFWPLAMPLLPISLEAGIDSYGRIMSGIERLSDSCD